MPYKLKDKILFCGTNSGRDIDKFKETQLTKEEAEKINCPIIKEALAHLECKVIEEITIGDHALFIGKIVNEKINKEDKRTFQLDKNEFTTTVD